MPSVKSQSKPATMMLMRKPTVKDVAKMVGLSHTAVSLTLRGKPGVSLKQQDRIRKAAKELGYQPKAAAQMLRSDRTGYLGLILEPGGPEQVTHSGTSSSILGHFLYACQQCDQRYYVEYFQKPNDEFEPPHQLSASLVDGIIVGGYVDAQLQQWLLEQKHYPWVSLNEPGPYAVEAALEEGTQQAVKAFYERGHRNIAYGGGPYHYIQHEQGRQGYLQAMSKLGLPVDESWIGHFGDLSMMENAYAQRQWAHQLITSKNRPTAFIGFGIGVGRNIHIEAASLGLNVPRDVSIIAVGMSESAMDTSPALCTIEVDYKTMLPAALEMLNDQLSGNFEGIKQLRVPPNLVLRQSIGNASVG